MSIRVWIAVAGLVAALASAPAGGQPAPANPPAPATPSTMAPATAGYLATGTAPNSLRLIPPPPAPGSAAQARDDEGARAALALRGGPRWDLATEDANLTFPAAAGTFSCAIGTTISEADTPKLYALLRRTLSDIGRSPYPTKTRYQRARPFTVNGKPQCTPALDGPLRGDGSYPSGHAAIGWGWALILAEAAPDRADAVLARGRAFTESRRICNVHWLSDLEEGRTMGAAVVARLHASDEFRADLAAARAELTTARAKGLGPTRDCAKEAAQMAIG